MTVATRVERFIRSQRLAFTLLLLLALLAAAGTFLPAERMESFYLRLLGAAFLPVLRAAGLVDTYRSPLFLGLFAFLCVNLTYCTWHRFSRRRAAGSAGPAAWSDLVMHFSVLVILSGGMGKGLWGFVGTQHLFLDVNTDTVYDWRTDSEVPLGFTLAMKEIVRDYYPMRVLFGVGNAATGEKIGLMEVREGQVGVFPAEDLELDVIGFDPSGERIEVRALHAGEEQHSRISVDVEETRPLEIGPYSLSLVAWRRDLRRVRGRVAVLKDSDPVKEEWLVVNSRIAYEGTSIFQTSWGEDKYMNPFIGIQVSRDPAAPLFWTGCVLFSLSLPLSFYFRHRRSRNNVHAESR